MNNRRKIPEPVEVERRAKVELETSEDGCSIAHIEDDTGEYVVLETPRDDAFDFAMRVELANAGKRK
jgi:hypothetical protein